jgi:cytoskeletal protein CcmA (bactofilin family)
MTLKKSNTSILENDATVEGKITCNGQLIIKGTIKGNLAGADVVVAKEGRLLADADVTSLTIDGTFEGEARATDQLTVLANGSCSGRVSCKNLMVEAGGVLNAAVIYLKSTDNKTNFKL